MEGSRIRFAGPHC